MDSLSFLDLIRQGYYATYPLLFCSVVALAVAGERRHVGSLVWCQKW